MIYNDIAALPTMTHEVTSFATSLLPKTLFDYEVVSRIGEGAGSVIYAVCHPETGQLYALKHVVRKADKDIRYIEQLQNEFEVTKGFRHPVLRKCVDLKINKKLLGGPSEAALIMELVDGTPINQQALPPVGKLIDVFTQVGHGLVALHKQRYIHCDLKPSNILTCPDGQVKVIDFGQAVRTGTVKERVQGTPDFIAPEQVRCKAVDPTTDVFNFGATLYWALSGRRMPTLFTVSKEQRDILKEQHFPTPSQLNPDAPEPLSKLAMWCVKISRASRPADMEMVVAGLDKIAEALNLTV